jgi:glycosyltransferase involved in cell wall biosynthesis
VRVLFLNDLSDPRIGSSIRQMYQHAARLRERGHETALVTAVQQASDATPTEILGMRVFRLHSDYDARWRAWVGLDNRRVRAPFERVLAEWRPDVVHSHLVHTHLSYASLGAARRAGAAVVFTAHDVMSFCYQKLTCFHGGAENGGELRDYTAHWQKCVPCQRLRYRPGRNAAIRAVLERDVHRVTAVSHELARAMAANGLRVDRVIHNAIEPRASAPSAEAVLAFRRKHGLEHAGVVAIAGRLHEQKGVLQLFKAVARVFDEHAAVRLMVLGHRKVYDEEFAAAARELGIEALVVPTGWLDGEELACAYAATDVFMTPSICFDTFGLVNLEAMEHARPVVATAFGGSPEVIEDGVTGFVVNPFRTEELAERILRLLRDRELASRLGAAGRARMLASFAMARLDREFDEEYRSALELARSPAPEPPPGPPIESRDASTRA